MLHTGFHAWPMSRFPKSKATKHITRHSSDLQEWSSQEAHLDKLGGNNWATSFWVSLHVCLYSIWYTTKGLQTRTPIDILCSFLHFRQKRFCHDKSALRIHVDIFRTLAATILPEWILPGVVNERTIYFDLDSNPKNQSKYPNYSPPTLTVSSHAVW